jgi:hypothetical protein
MQDGIQEHVDELGVHLAGRPTGPDDLVLTAARGGPIRESKWVPGYSSRSTSAPARKSRRTGDGPKQDRWCSR